LSIIPMRAAGKNKFFLSLASAKQFLYKIGRGKR
jgi:hypothetical protein